MEPPEEVEKDDQHCENTCGEYDEQGLQPVELLARVLSLKHPCYTKQKAHQKRYHCQPVGDATDEVVHAE